MSNNNKTILIVLIIVIAILAYIVLNKNANEVIAPEITTDSIVEEAIKADTTDAINNSLDKINVDTALDEDFKAIDEEVNSL